VKRSEALQRHFEFFSAGIAPIFWLRAKDL
jgi:hypothetical protein